MKKPFFSLPGDLPLQALTTLLAGLGCALPLCLAMELTASPGLLLASRRMRRTGATLVFTTRLTPRVADALIALSRMGPRTALTLVTDGEMTDEQQKLLHLLQNSGVKARHMRCL